LRLLPDTVALSALLMSGLPTPIMTWDPTIAPESS
jgi:hypothetical protein